MRLVALGEKRFKVAAVVEGDEVPVLRFLQDAPSDMQGSARGMPALFDRYATEGRRLLSTEVFHEANKEQGIWEFIKGRLRVFCFVDTDGTLLVLTHGAVKKSRKADPMEIARAVRIKDAFLVARRQGTLQWEPTK
ncbi:MAG TPA: type II toxin-antitoxin system RelE/ParE family toxin [Accumulibacter sp.]|uniref:type II toxin-antitoxin system RelE/ParE family toxin n=1 Tax=Accumulibacter sp. TaxID=2053492 RepID=UPI002626A9BE|nr:type II toxin-antitoxin system RelE/ParE family toxin [Accumulibacter sp.]MDS4014169.1 type II toxin-antitoxin system RelE/ParE family toxin [Accumulibacter sp.]HMV04987.1 type II toxin-antitoxin system RelE/ParE family toxin [Accumulibacter sp.]HMW64242.1 type II toxin-antitoxin system RelE/ParE family toxin [Accumulibacter sp.]HMW79915.1 type II toxin-antitoxin system RelE/ParE family toxin [Accumulibacter sp.]HMX68531.1 type II toxin-antitoxin system RelE/ParE family toxin [Accumulibacte